MSKPVNKEDFRSWNEMMARKYDPDAFHHHPSRLVRWVEGKRVKTVLEQLRAQPGERVLEIGCGAGNVLEKIGLARPFGIDLSEQLLKKASKKTGGAVYLALAYGEKLCFKDAAFEKVFCTEVLEHVLEPGLVICEAHRVLTVSGRAIFSVPNEDVINKIKSLLIRLRLFGFIFRKPRSDYQVPRKMEDEWHIHIFNLDKLITLLPPSLKIEKVLAIPGRWLPLHYVISCVKR